MIDLKLTWGSDLEIASFGDFDIVSGPDLTKQRLLRRLLTNPNDYIWQGDYGAGLAQFVGVTTNMDRLTGTVRKQTLKEPSIDRSQPIKVDLHASSGSDRISLNIQFKDVADELAQSVDLLAKV